MYVNGYSLPLVLFSFDVFPLLDQDWNGFPRGKPFQHGL
jgi:hypothetical protein